MHDDAIFNEQTTFNITHNTGPTMTMKKYIHASLTALIFTASLAHANPFILKHGSVSTDPCAQLPASGSLNGNWTYLTTTVGSCTWIFNPTMKHEGQIVDIQGSLTGGRPSIPGITCADDQAEVIGTCSDGVLDLKEQKTGAEIKGYVIGSTVTGSGDAPQGGTISFHLTIPSKK